MEQSYDLLSNDLTLNAVGQDALLTAARWGKFLAIVGFIFCVLMAVVGIYMSSIMSYSTYNYSSSYINPLYLMMFYIVLAIILFFPCLYLLKFSNKMQEAIKTTNQDSLDISLINLKAMFKFYGIFTIVILGVYAIAIIFLIIGAVAR